MKGFKVKEVVAKSWKTNQSLLINTSFNLRTINRMQNQKNHDLVH